MGALLHDIYIDIDISIYISMFIHLFRKEATFHGIFIFVIIKLLISLHNVQNKVYFKYFKRNFVFNHDILFLHTYNKLKVSYKCIVSY